MILNLIKVVQTTRAHPRVGVLIATVIKGIDDIVHFGILFIIVFITFAWYFCVASSLSLPRVVSLLLSLSPFLCFVHFHTHTQTHICRTGMWAFAMEREEFATLQDSMTTQFLMLNGEFPEVWF